MYASPSLRQEGRCIHEVPGPDPRLRALFFLAGVATATACGLLGAESEMGDAFLATPSSISAGIRARTRVEFAG